MTQAGSAGFPPTAQVTLRNKRTGEERTFEQTELSIEGEARLLGLVGEIGQRLVEVEFPWATLGSFFDEGSSIDWPAAIGMLGKVAAVAPDIVVDSACVFFGIYPTELDGKPNPQYDRDRQYLKGALKFADWVDLIQTFVNQNDYRRLADPFVEALTAANRLGQQKVTEPS